MDPPFQKDRVPQLTEHQLAFLEQHEAIKAVQRDSRVSIQAANVSPNITATKAAYNLDRIDQPSLPLDGLYHYDSDGTGTNLYVIDTVSNYMFHLINKCRYSFKSSQNLGQSPVLWAD